MIRAAFLVFFILVALIKSTPTNAQVIYESVNYKQKERMSIDSNAYNRWTRVESAKINNNGSFTSYIIRNDSMTNCNTTILTENNGRWIMRLPNISGVEFTADNKMAMFIARDTLFVIKLGDTYFDKIPNVSLFFIPNHTNGEWIALMYKSSDTLNLHNLYSGKNKEYPSVKSSFFSEDGKKLLLQIEDSTRDCYMLNLVDVSSGKLTNIWNGKGLMKVIPNSSASQFALLISEKQDNSRSIWFYEIGKDRPKLLLGNRTIAADSFWVLNDISKLSVGGQYITFSANRLKKVSPDHQVRNSTVNIWSYLDTKLQTIQLADGDYTSGYSFIINCKDNHITQLCGDNETILASSCDDEVYLIEHISGDADGLESNWNSSAQRTYFVKSIKEKKNVLLNISGSQMVFLSPSGKYVVFYDKERASFFSYDVKLNVYKNITSGMNVCWSNSYGEDKAIVPRGIGGWLNSDTKVLIYDKFDIWMIDLTGIESPRNITNRYGLKNDVVFYLGLSGSSNQIFSNHDILILNGVNIKSKQNGFFRKKIDQVGDPYLLTMGDFVYQLIENPYLEENGIYPLKAMQANGYIIMRMKANESPNYFFTSDFKNFKQLSHVYPEKKYNWYNTQLYTWKRSDGILSQGVLYKPDNFDSTKKYPVIFYYYEKKSFSLNEYLFPKKIVGGCNIDIPTFVSNGYLIFTPDIDYVIGDPMQGTLNALVSAAEYVAKLPFVASDKMGIGGCSFGGTQTNYVITHSNLFAAAYSASSMTDFVSAYGDVPGRYRSIQCYFEEGGQGRMGGTLWQIPEKYIKNSAIFYADKVTTPLLLMHTTNDAICSFSQAIEFFTALRRLGKKVWLLEYTDGNHGIFGRSADDYALRLNQFFDHYLKGKPAARWMTRGIPARAKGIDYGFQIDSSIITPGSGLLIEPKEQ
jgi:dienelactone hydrolase